MPRWTQAEYERFLRHGPSGVLTEKAWQQAVTAILRQHHYGLLYHTFDSRRSPSGFPDLFAAHALPGHPALAIELKTDTGQVTPAQTAWLTALAGASEIITAVWRPKDLDAILAFLKEQKGHKLP